MAISDLLNSLQPAADDQGSLDVWLGIPPGYLPLPVVDSADRLAEALPTLVELCPPESRDLLFSTVDTFALLLSELEQRNTVFCGLGWHTAPDDESTLVASSLVASLQTTGGERNPRLVLGDLIKVSADADDHAQADLVDLPNGPALFFESVRSLRKPRLPGEEGDPGRADVYQLEVIVPSEKGDRLAVLEFSTPQVEYGVYYREMMVLLAHSVAFNPPPGSEEQGTSARKIHDALGGLGL
ncbi:hypothetical protein KDK95_24330 [Actinospica sp. MGRD01-02]|uniref:Uncharacterized protein n=1 Tax=Actinospica acidithermotolerans TaxID=2828514 RepID=A0A941EDE0_9ACTN|nr:hypothetical protein [Actinospica acidithermotolerans]MBR7829456.1 hypothetical protein [Actinospica acidithermotolerans]